MKPPVILTVVKYLYSPFLTLLGTKKYYAFNALEQLPVHPCPFVSNRITLLVDYVSLSISLLQSQSYELTACPKESQEFSLQTFFAFGLIVGDA